MTPKRTSAAERALSGAAPVGSADAAVRVVIVTLDNHLAGAVLRAQETLARTTPGVTLTLHAAADWAGDPEALARCTGDIARGDIVLATMLFMEDHIQAVLPALTARAPHCDAMIGAMSAGEIVKLTRMGPYRMDGSAKGPMAMLKKLRARAKPGATGGEKQMPCLRRLPSCCPSSRARPGCPRLLPHAAVLAGRFGRERRGHGPPSWWTATPTATAGRCAARSRRLCRLEYPEVGVYHPRLAGRMAASADALPATGDTVGTVGLLVLRSYVLAGDSAHYGRRHRRVRGQGDARRSRLRQRAGRAPGDRGAFHEGTVADHRRAGVAERVLARRAAPPTTTPRPAQAVLAKLDVPYVAAHPLEFQTFQQWSASGPGPASRSRRP
jgi:magnesium chelatase subunit H